MTAIGCLSSKQTWLRLACALALGFAVRSAMAADPSPDELAARRQKIADMSEVERNLLLEKQTKFLAMSPAEQDSIRQLHEELEADARNNGSLQAVLRNYHAWLKSLSPWQRAEIHAERDPEKRINLIRRIKEQEGTESYQPVRPEMGAFPKTAEGDAKRKHWPPMRLTNDDFRKSMDVIANSLTLSEDEQKEWAKLPPPQRNIKILLKAVGRQKADEAQAPRERWPSVALTKRIVDAISDPKTRERLDDSERTVDQHRWFLRQLMFGALMREASDELEKRRPPDDQMRAYLRNLDPEERDKLMRQWDDGHRHWLLRRYLEDQGDAYTHDLTQLQKVFVPRFDRGDNRQPVPDRGRRGRQDAEDREGPPRRQPRDRDRDAPIRAPRPKPEGAPAA